MASAASKSPLSHALVCQDGDAVDSIVLELAERPAEAKERLVQEVSDLTSGYLAAHDDLVARLYNLGSYLVKTRLFSYALFKIACDVAKCVIIKHFAKHPDHAALEKLHWRKATVHINSEDLQNMSHAYMPT